MLYEAWRMKPNEGEETQDNNLGHEIKNPMAEVGDLTATIEETTVDVESHATELERLAAMTALSWG